jgi:hypothetical protein
MEWIGSMMAICLVQIENDQYFKVILDWVFKVILNNLIYYNLSYFSSMHHSLTYVI